MSKLNPKPKRVVARDRRLLVCPYGTTYDKSHIEERGYHCGFRHTEYRWPARLERKFMILGDSIVKYINLCDFTEVVSFPGANIESVCWKLRLGNVDLEGIQILILHVGTNDFSNDISVEGIIGRFRRLITYLIQRKPELLIGISAVIPRPCDHPDLREKLALVNSSLHKLCRENPHTRFLASYRAFIDKTSKETLLNLFAQDKLHLNYAGTEVFKKFLIGNIRSLQSALKK